MIIHVNERIIFSTFVALAFESFHCYLSHNQKQHAMTLALTAELTIESLPIKNAALLYRAINHDLRQQILKLLDQNKRMIVTQIYSTLSLEQSVVSQHLAILRKACFVKTERLGKCIFYSVNYEWLNTVQQTSKVMLHTQQKSTEVLTLNA